MFGGQWHPVPPGYLSLQRLLTSDRCLADAQMCFEPGTMIKIGTLDSPPGDQFAASDTFEFIFLFSM